MPRRKVQTPLEPLRVVERETWEDEDYYYVKETYNRGGTNIDRHPKHPERPKEEIFEEVAQLLLMAWRRPGVQERIAEKERMEREAAKPPDKKQEETADA